MDEKIMKFAESIPMDELFDEIKKLTGIQDIKFTHKLHDRGNRVFIQFESDELVDKVGFLKLMFKSIKIAQFSSCVEYSRDGEDLLYWGSASFRYDHPGGGSNGCEFLNFTYYEKTKTWEFYVVGENI